MGKFEFADVAVAVSSGRWGNTFFLEAKSQKQPIRLVCSRFGAKTVRALWRELVAEIVWNQGIDSVDNSLDIELDKSLED